MILLPNASMVQRYDGIKAYQGKAQRATKGVLHTTEGGGWPAYSGGADAPNLTAWWTGRELLVRQHFPLDMSSRALKNLAGGVQTNGDDVVQIELVGTCDPVLHAKAPSITFWPEAPDAAIDALAALLRQIESLTGIPHRPTPRPWLPYPASYGNSSARMTFAEWDAFTGWCGHQHVAENVHGDPGNINIARLFGGTSAEDDDMSQAQVDQILAGLDRLSQAVSDGFANVGRQATESNNGVQALIKVADRPLQVQEVVTAQVAALGAQVAALAQHTAGDGEMTPDEVAAAAQAGATAALAKLRVVSEQ